MSKETCYELVLKSPDGHEGCIIFYAKKLDEFLVELGGAASRLKDFAVANNDSFKQGKYLLTIKNVKEYIGKNTVAFNQSISDKMSAKGMINSLITAILSAIIINVYKHQKENMNVRRETSTGTQRSRETDGTREDSTTNIKQTKKGSDRQSGEED
jgi:hypothetical protein